MITGNDVDDACLDYNATRQIRLIRIAKNYMNYAVFKTIKYNFNHIQVLQDNGLATCPQANENQTYYTKYKNSRENHIHYSSFLFIIVDPLVSPKGRVGQRYSSLATCRINVLIHE